MIADSGADQHITGRKDWLLNYKPFPSPKTVSLTDKNEALATGTGDLDVEAWNGQSWEQSTLHDVLHIPGAVNLFSECVVAQKGYVIIRDSGTTLLLKDQVVQAVAHYDRGLYFMKFRITQSRAYVAHSLSAKIWHDRLSHINLQYIKETINKNAATGIIIKDNDSSLNCHDCHIGKETRKPFPRVSKPSNVKVCEMVHADLSGRMPKPSLGRAWYFLLIKDEASGYRSIYFLERKSQAPEYLIRFFHLLETQTGNKLKVFKSDNGGEFINETLENYFIENGVIHHKTVPYCPESNGKIEREMRTLKDTARAMLHHANAPEYLWAEAMACTVYIHNRVLNKQSDSITA